jgi:hypothetical protein
MFGLVRRRLLQEAMAASADQVADLDAAVRRNFQEWFRALGRDCHPSAWAGEEQVALQVHSTTLPLVADQWADPRSGVQAAAAKVEGHRARHQAEVRRVGFRLAEACLAVAMERRVAALADAEPRAQPCPKARVLMSWEPTPPEQRAWELLA